MSPISTLIAYAYSLAQIGALSIESFVNITKSIAINDTVMTMASLLILSIKRKTRFGKPIMADD
tara:strand:+ start:395 stop:586 length:192 start_codon:yes stop_codon:yes gene_type:complete